VAERGRQGKVIAWIGAGAAVVGAFVGPTASSTTVT
jgi:hypothetical protein